MDLKRTILQMRNKGDLCDIRRNVIQIDMDEAMNAVKQIGRYITPNFVIDDDNRFVYENLIKYVHADRTCMCLDPETRQVVPADIVRKGIFLCGECGTGKSVAMKVASLYAEAIGAEVHIYDAMQSKFSKFALFGVKVRVDEICDTFATTGNITDYKIKKILTVDDLGAEPGETLYMGNRQNVMRQVIEFRGDLVGSLTSFTSNAPMLHKYMIDKYGDRAVSRFKQLGNYYELRGKDRRK